MKNWFIIGFSLFWIITLFTDYWNKHILHQQSFSSFSYLTYVIVWGLLTVGIGFALLMSSINPILKSIQKSWILYPIFIAGLFLTFLVNVETANVAMTFSKTLLVTGKFIGYTTLLIVLWLSAYALGNKLNSILKLSLSTGPSFTMDLVSGLFAYCSILFLLGLVKLLYMPVILVLLILPFVFNHKSILKFVKDLFTKPINKENLNWICIGLFSIILMSLSINFIANLAPFPSGFDSRNYYMNVAKLIADNHGLVHGYQPYPWQLFISQGQLLIGNNILPMLISFSTIVFVLIGLYELATKYFNISLTQTLLLITLVLVTPAVQNHLFVELKIDLALLLVQLTMLLLILDRIRTYRKIPINPMLKDIIFLGILTGFGASIKMLNFYLLFALLVTIWTMLYSYKGFFTTFLLSIGVILLAKFDSVSGLDKYHLSIDYIKWGALVIGSLGLVAIALQSMPKFLKATKLTALYIVVILATMTPWIAKNFLETKSLDPNTLIRGAEPAPNINMQIIKQNYKSK